MIARTASFFLSTLLVLGFAVSALAQQLLLSPPTTPITDRPTELEVIVLNDTTDQLHFDPPQQLAGSIEIDGASRDVMLILIEDHPILIDPGAFSKVKYQLAIDDTFVGEARLTLDDSQASIKLDLQPPTTTKSSAQQQLMNALKADPDFHTEQGLVEYLANHFKAYEPMYFLIGNENPSAKFQLSLKYQVFNQNGWIAKHMPVLGGLYVSYSQTSFWDLEGDSKPFFDNSYRPGLMLAYEQLDRFFKDSAGERSLPEWIRFDLSGGIQHESNGRSGDESRSMNYVYVQPSITFGNRKEWFVNFGPRFLTYVGDLSDNEDIKDYRGYADLRMVMGQGGGLQLAALGRIGEGTEHGSLQLDLSFPIRKMTGDNFDIYLHGQYFTGYGESLLNYNESDETFRVGISVVR